MKKNRKNIVEKVRFLFQRETHLYVKKNVICNQKMIIISVITEIKNAVTVPCL